MENLSGKKVAILSTDGFEQVELIEPKKLWSRAGPIPMSSLPTVGK